MDQRERQVIDELFGKLRQLNAQAPQRDPEAEAYIRQQVSTLPAAPYYMAQAILVQEQALANLQTRVQELERQLAERPAGGGGFLSGLFGGGQPAPAPRPPVPQQPHPGAMPQHPMHAGHGSPWGGRSMGGGGGGFLAGAMQTALGVAGGMLVANALSSAFEGGAAEATDLAQGVAEDAGLAGAEEASFAGTEETPVFEDLSADFGGEEEI